jgi:hypothetical protein
MASTSAFGWETPDDTDLVKDGAAAIRTLGNSIDTSMSELKGGTTGQILSKTSATDMDFTWVAQTTVPESYGFSAGKNKIINGDMNIWQRGTSFNATSAANVYSADRWTTYQNGSGTFTVSQQAFTAGAAPVAGYESQYFIRNAITTLGTTTAFILSQRIEDVRTFAGQTVTVSFWSKSLTSLGTSVSLTQNFGSGGSGSVTTSGSSITNTTSWQRFSQTITLPSISGKTIGTSSYLELNFTSSLTANQSIDIWGVQVESGSTATSFQTATGTIQGELAACQRYYYRETIPTTPSRFGWGIVANTTQADITITYPVPMRTFPTALEQTGTATDYSVITSGSTVTTCSAVPVFGNATTTQSQTTFTVASGLVAGQACLGRPANTSAYLGWSAEL